MRPPPQKEIEEKVNEGFTQVQNRRKQAQKKPTIINGKKKQNNNSFEALNRLPEEEEVENPHKNAGKDLSMCKEDPSSLGIHTPTNQADP
jgi:hypothetical protein